MDKKVLFAIPDMDELPDCFRSVMPSRSFTPDADGIIRGWPSFHVSKADPDGGYQTYTYTVRFSMAQPEDCALQLGVIVSTPRLPSIRLSVNGSEGCVYPFPAPSRDKEIRPGHALHAAIYNRQDLRVFIPGTLLKAGENTLSITAEDELPELMVTNREAVARLDRMADACGWHYGALSLERGAVEEPGAEVRPTVLYARRGDMLMERVDVTLTPPAGLQDVSGSLRLIWADGETVVPYHMEANAFGSYTFSCWIPDGTGEVQYALSGAVTQQGTFRPCRKWHVYITPHAHTDIGYTHRQSEVAERMSRNLDTALETLRQKPDFSYILDSAWALDDYLETRDPARRQELLEQVKAGRIGVPSNYVDLLTQTASLEDLIHNSDFSEGLLSTAGLRADRVDMVDVASATSAYPTILSGMGVKWMLHANNQDRGPFRLNGNLHRHSPFWWEGPDGSRILVWLSRMYCELKKVCGSPGSIPAAERGLGMWLMDYEQSDYQPDAVILYGMEADNTDIDVRMADFVSRWKKTYVYPQLIPSNGSSFFEYVSAWSDAFPVYRGDEGGWWEDGAASSLRESVAIRRAQDGLKCAEPLESFATMLTGGQFPLRQYDEAWKQVVLFDEHTWGSFMSQADPESLLQQDSWAFKKAMSDSALNRTNALLSRSASRISLLWNNGGREVVVYNPYSFPVSGWALVEIAKHESVCDAEGREVRWRVVNITTSQKQILLQVDELPGYGYRRYTLRPGKPEDVGGWCRSLTAAPRTVLENDWYRVTVDTELGEITSLYDKELQRELCRAPMGELLYAMGGEGSMLRGNHAGLRRDGARVTHAFLPSEARTEETALDQRVVLTGEAFRGHATVTFTLPRDRKELLLRYDYDKAATTAPEAVYVAFPFQAGEDAPVLSDSQIGWVDWQKDTLPGCCREWLPLQTSVLVRDQDCTMQLASPDAFLFTVNSPVMGKWRSDLNVRGGQIYSYVLNNYWHTNYLGEQGGLFTFRYAITSAREIAPEQAFRFGWTHRRGLLAQRMSYQEFRHDVPRTLQNPAGGLLFEAPSDHIVVNTIRRSRSHPEAWLVRLLETGGRAGEIRLSMPGRRIAAMQDVDHQEHALGERRAPMPVAMGPWALRSVLIWVEPADEEKGAQA